MPPQLGKFLDGEYPLEDSLIFSTLIGVIKTNNCWGKDRFEGLRSSRHPHTQRIIDSSGATELIVVGFKQETELILDTLREELLPRWGFIMDSNNAKHLDEALVIAVWELKVYQAVDRN